MCVFIDIPKQTHVVFSISHIYLRNGGVGVVFNSTNIAIIFKKFCFQLSKLSFIVIFI